MVNCSVAADSPALPAGRAHARQARRLNLKSVWSVPAAALACVSIGSHANDTAIGVDNGQGYLFSRPVPAAEIIARFTSPAARANPKKSAVA